MEHAQDGTGEAARRDRVSFWLDSTRDDGHRGSSLPAREAEAVVVGAGIVGLTCALRLAEAGRAVVVVDAGPIAAGVSGYTTAKLTAGHRLCYSRLEGSLGADAAALYARAQMAAIDFVRGLVAERGIDCDLEEVPNYVVALDDDELEQVAAETEAARRAGLAAETVTELDVRFPARGAALLPEQAQFHPRAYLLAVARLVEEAGGQLVTGLRVREITGAGPLDVVCDSGAVRAPVVVVATHYPIVEQGFFVPRIHPRRSYVVAAPLEEEPPGGMYITVGTPTRSVRTALRKGAGRLLLVGGEGHRVGQEADAARRYETLERWMRAHFSVGRTAYRWSTQDNYPVDGVPFAGRAGEDEGLFVATGFAGWGMSNGTMAGLAIAAEIEGTPEPWRDLFALARGEGARGTGRMLRESANVGAQQAAGAVRPRRGSPDELWPGEGAVLSIDGTDVAVSRDRSGALHSVSPRCTHMGCVVTWNDAESSWDCPCHGSRFDPTGAVLHGPALAPLREVALPAEARR